MRKPGTATSFSKIVMKTSSRPHSALSGSAAKLLTMLQLLALDVLPQDRPRHPNWVPHPYHLITRDHFHRLKEHDIECLTILLEDS